jgi:Glu-tRNA(Gln) amidotransferase subunit E-like FAD-binding protein
MNRKNAFFQKHILNSKVDTEAEICKKINSQIFGFCRVRKSVMTKVDELILHMVQKQKKFDYNYYLTKNCPLLDDWTAQKKQMVQQAKAGGA